MIASDTVDSCFVTTDLALTVILVSPEDISAKKSIASAVYSNHSLSISSIYTFKTTERS